MPKRIIVFVLLILSISYGKGQTTFFKTISGYNESCSQVQQTTDGGYFMIGRSDLSTSSSYSSGYVIKTNSIGDTLWTKGYALISEFTSGFQTSDNGYVLLGSKKNTVSLHIEIYLVKIDTVGTIQWQKTFSSPLNLAGTSIKPTLDGGYILSGYGTGLGAGLSDMYLIKLDSIGNLQWDKIIGGPDNDYAYSVEQTNDLGFIISGKTDPSGNSKTYIVKLDSAGNFEWSKQFLVEGYGKGRSVIQTNDNGYLILGEYVDTTSGSITSSSNLIKVDSAGNFVWSKIYVGTHGWMTSSLQKASNGRFTISGAANGQMLFTLIDSIGNVIWSRLMIDHANSTYGTSGTFASQTSDGGFITIGGAVTPSSVTYTYFIKLDSLGDNGCDSLIFLNIISNTIAEITPLTSVTSGLTVTTPPVFYNARSSTITTYCSSVGINEPNSISEILVYPNPSKGQFNFSGLEDESKIEVFDVTGKKIHQSLSNEAIQTINISDFHKGLYLYRITKEMKLLKSGKIVLE